MPRRFSPVAFGLATVLLSGCVGALPELDFDFRGNAISGARVETAPRPEPDASGLISYESYQVVVGPPRRHGGGGGRTRRPDLGGTGEFQRPRRERRAARRRGACPAAPGDRWRRGRHRHRLHRARGAIDEAEPGRTAAAPEVQPGTEPVRHRVGRGETAYSIARLYGVSVRALAEWNGLGPDLAVRENQYLLIPIVLEESASEGTQGAGHEHRPRPRRRPPSPCPIRSRPPPCRPHPAADRRRPHRSRNRSRNPRQRQRLRPSPARASPVPSRVPSCGRFPRQMKASTSRPRPARPCAPPATARSPRSPRTPTGCRSS